MTREQLIAYYEKRLEKVKAAYSTTYGSTENWKGQPYIEGAEKDLEEVKNGREW